MESAAKLKSSKLTSKRDILAKTEFGGETYERSKVDEDA